MKVTIADFEIHLVSFLKDVASVVPSPLHKFAIGSIVAGKLRELEALMASFADEEGYIDLDKAREVIAAGFAASGDTLIIPIPGIPLIGLQGINLKITKADTDKFFAGFSSSHPATEGAK